MSFLSKQFATQDIPQLLYGANMMNQLTPQMGSTLAGLGNFAENRFNTYIPDNFNQSMSYYTAPIDRLLTEKISNLQNTNERHSYGRRVNEMMSQNEALSQKAQLATQRMEAERQSQLQSLEGSFKRQQTGLQMMGGLLSQPMGPQTMTNVSSNNNVAGTIGTAGQLVGGATSAIGNMAQSFSNSGAGYSAGGVSGSGSLNGTAGQW